MTRKHWLLVTVTLILVGASLYLNKDWFAHEPIHIFFRMMPQRDARRNPTPRFGPVDPVLFGFSEPLRLTSVKVVLADEALTNKYPMPVWHLVSESNSIPTKEFFYGGRLSGMHPAVKSSTPADLSPGTGYRLLIQAGKFKGECDFVPRPATS